MSSQLSECRLPRTYKGMKAYPLCGTILDIFHDINREGTTIALVTHDPVVATHADRVLILVDGTIADDVTLGNYHPNDHQERLAHINGLMAARGV